MPSLAQHLEQFERNLTTAERLASFGDYDWAVVALFYAALHLVQSRLIASDSPARTHQERNRVIRANAELRPMLEAFMTLRNVSEQARYECRRFTLDEYELIRAGSFSQVVQHLQSLGDTR